MKIQTVFGNPRKSRKGRKAHKVSTKRKIHKRKLKSNPRKFVSGGLFESFDAAHIGAGKVGTLSQKSVAKIVQKAQAKRAKKIAKVSSAAMSEANKKAGKVAAIESQLSRGSLPGTMRDSLYRKLAKAKIDARKATLQALKSQVGGSSSKALVIATVAKPKRKRRKGVRVMAKRKGRKSPQSRTRRRKYSAKSATGAKFASVKRQSYRGKKYLPVLHRGSKFAVARKGGLGLMSLRNPFGMAGAGLFGEPTISFGNFFDTGVTKSEIGAIVLAGIAAPMIPALIARVPFLNKAQAQIGAYGVPASLIIIGSVVNAKVENATAKNIGKALVTIGLFKLTSSLVSKFTAQQGGVSGFMGELLGYEGYEGYEGDEITEVVPSEAIEGYEGYEGEDMHGGVQNDPSAVDQQMGVVDFTPRGQYGMVPEGMSGVDFTPRSQVRPFGEIPEGMSGRDGADFGRDGADFGNEAGAMG